jgi:O-antigen biosynthesis protein WbqP
LKRAFDLVVAAVGIVVLSPFILAAVAVARSTSPGPGIFSQVRIGQDGRPFRCHKLRTMYVDTPSVPTHDAAVSHITPVGRFLRRTKLDELPQLWNVLRGEMSFVGPRPCLPSQIELIEERRMRGVLALKPGITGLSQIRGIDMSTPVKLAESDADYLRRASFGLDLNILFRTVFSGDGRGDRVKR